MRARGKGQPMKKVLSVVIVFLATLCLVACTKSLKGTYISKTGATKSTLVVIDNKSATLSIDSLFGTYTFDGTINEKDKTIAFKGMVLGKEAEEFATYEVIDSGDLSITTKEVTTLYRKEK